MVTAVAKIRLESALTAGSYTEGARGGLLLCECQSPTETLSKVNSHSVMGPGPVVGSGPNPVVDVNVAPTSRANSRSEGVGVRIAAVVAGLLGDSRALNRFTEKIHNKCFSMKEMII